MKPTIKKIKELDDDYSNVVYEITREGSEEKVQIMIPWEYINKKHRSIDLDSSVRPFYGLNLVCSGSGHYE
jgi:hypothetical protein